MSIGVQSYPIIERWTTFSGTLFPYLDLIIFWLYLVANTSKNRMNLLGTWIRPGRISARKFVFISIWRYKLISFKVCSNWSYNLCPSVGLGSKSSSEKSLILRSGQPLRRNGSASQQAMPSTKTSGSRKMPGCMMGRFLAEKPCPVVVFRSMLGSILTILHDYDWF